MAAFGLVQNSSIARISWKQEEMAAGTSQRSGQGSVVGGSLHHTSRIDITALCSVIAAVSTSLILVVNIGNSNPALLCSLPAAARTDASGGATPTPTPLQRGHDFHTAALLRAGLIARSPLRTAGCSAHAFVVTAMYRAGPARWTVLGLLPGHVSRYTPQAAAFRCHWIDAAVTGGSNSSSSSGGSCRAAARASVVTPGGAMFPWTYVTAVVTCEFAAPVGADARGGALVLQVLGPRVGGPAWGWSGKAPDDDWMYPQLRGLYAGRGATVNDAVVDAVAAEAAMLEGRSVAAEEESREEEGVAVVAGTERPHAYDAGLFRGERVEYDNLYCGSAVYGDLDVAAVNQWLAYHLHLFGNRTHFVFYDAGAVRGNQRMEKGLEHWIQLGLLSINELQEAQMYPGYYHHQHHAINDCINKYRFTAKRMWFMDVDEYIVVRAPHTLQSILDKYQDQDVLMLKSHKFSDEFCRRTSEEALPVGGGAGEPNNASTTTGHQALPGTEQGHQEVRQPPDDDAWTVERLLFSTPQTERKYVVLNPGNSRIRSVLVHAASTGLHHRVHQLDLGAEAGFYHYHGSVNKNKTQLCGRWLEPQATHARTNVTHPGTKKCVVTKWDYDDAILPQAASAKSFIRAFFADNGIPSLV